MISTTSQVLHDGVRNVVMQFTGVSDGAGQETDAVKVDASALSPPADRNLKILKVQYAVTGGVLQLKWGADDPQVFLNLSGQGEIEYCRNGGLVNGGGATATGDILASTLGFELDSAYSLTLDMVK